MKKTKIMKKLFVGVVLVLAMISCEKATEAKEFKTAYIDTSKLLDESTEANDIKAKYEGIAKEKGSRIKVEVDRLEAEQKSFSINAQKNGQAWAQQKYGELQQRGQEIQYAEQMLTRQLQGEMGIEMDYKIYNNNGHKIVHICDTILDKNKELIGLILYKFGNTKILNLETLRVVSHGKKNFTLTFMPNNMTTKNEKNKYCTIKYTDGEFTKICS